MSGASCSEDLAGLSNASDANAAATQAASVLSGVFTGLGTLWAREQLGGRLPVVSIETLGSDVTSARVRAGYQFDEFIPESLRQVVRGLYLEGSVSVDSSNNESTSAASGAVGFLMRLQFPRNIVGEVAGVPSQDSWRVDVTWEP
jgi:hypothetical protein